jgi:hypothetical protein
MPNIYELITSVNLENGIQEMKWIEYCKTNKFGNIYFN